MKMSEKTLQLMKQYLEVSKALDASIAEDTEYKGGLANTATYIHVWCGAKGDLEILRQFVEGRATLSMKSSKYDKIEDGKIQREFDCEVEGVPIMGLCKLPLEANI